MTKLHNINEELNFNYDKKIIDFLKSMIFWDGEYWDFDKKCNTLFKLLHKDEIPNNLILIFKKIKDILNIKYKDIEKREDLNSVIDIIFNELNNNKNLDIIKNFESYKK
jgi:hypothetical protein